jgi:hypothetical protein
MLISMTFRGEKKRKKNIIFLDEIGISKNIG